MKATLLTCLGVAAAAAPCIWDKDTLADELRGLPGSFELVTGRSIRHAKAYYEQRIRTLPSHLEKTPTDLGAWDDLAVAHEYLGDHRKAIEVIGKKGEVLREHPNAEQQYRFHANLGTFYAHQALREGKPSGFEKALLQLKEAIRINPNAHFGRELFQIDLIEYALAASRDPELWKKHNFLTWSGWKIEKRGWWSIAGALGYSGRIDQKSLNKKTTWKKAYTAVAGMLRFGGIEGAELFRVAGDLFAIKRDLHLAWWSYRRAVERGHPAKAQIEKAIAGIEKHWLETKKHVGARKLKIPTTSDYARVRASAKRWVEKFQELEAAMLAEGVDTSTTSSLQKLVKQADAAVPADRVQR